MPRALWGTVGCRTGRERPPKVTVNVNCIHAFVSHRHGMCHCNVRREPVEAADEEPEEAADPGFTEMEEAEDVRIVTDGGDE